MHQIRRINTIFIYVNDLARAKRFYGDVLDFGKPVIDGKFWVEFKFPDGNTHFALHSSDKHAGVNRAQNTIKLSFEVADIEKAAARLREHGVKFLFAPRKEYGFWLAEFEDMEGNHLRLYQRIDREPAGPQP